MTLTVTIGTTTKFYRDLERAQANRLISQISELFDGWNTKIDQVTVKLTD